MLLTRAPHHLLTTCLLSPPPFPSGPFSVCMRPVLPLPLTWPLVAAAAALPVVADRDDGLVVVVVGHRFLSRRHHAVELGLRCSTAFSLGLPAAELGFLPRAFLEALHSQLGLGVGLNLPPGIKLSEAGFGTRQGRPQGPDSPAGESGP